MQALKAIIILSSVEGLGVQTLRKILTAFSHPQEIIDIQDPMLLSEKAQIPIGLSESIIECSRNVYPDRILESCHEQGISILHCLDENYPVNLSKIYDPPVLLYVKGDLLPHDRYAIGIVGSRRCTPYGIQMAFKFSSELAERGITVVSGLALGIDARGHEGALKAKGRTIAVLGSGVDVVYPKENRKIYQKISEEGAVISEFPLGAEPRPFYFPKRNRIIAGLSLGILVVEASERSGSLITARLGAEEGREIYAIPGRIDSRYSQGTHRLLQEGAKLVTSADQILEDLYPSLELEGILLQKTDPGSESADQDKNEELTPENEGLTENEKVILELMGTEAMGPDDLNEKVPFDTIRILQILTRLEMKGKVKRFWGGRFISGEVYFR